VGDPEPRLEVVLDSAADGASALHEGSVLPRGRAAGRAGHHGAGTDGKGSYTVGIGMGSALGSPTAMCRRGTVEITGGLGAGLDVDLPASVKNMLNRTSIGRLLGGVNDVPLSEKMWSVSKREQTMPHRRRSAAG
jgi:hypothetical protein